MNRIGDDILMKALKEIAEYSKKTDEQMVYNG